LAAQIGPADAREQIAAVIRGIDACNEWPVRRSSPPIRRIAERLVSADFVEKSLRESRGAAASPVPQRGSVFLRASRAKREEAASAASSRCEISTFRATFPVSPPLPICPGRTLE
jgi:hypothetical protein